MTGEIEAKWIKDERTGNWEIRLYDERPRGRLRRGDQIGVRVAASGKPAERMTVKIHTVEGKVAYATPVKAKPR